MGLNDPLFFDIVLSRENVLVSFAEITAFY